jgi:hypothetical protein
LGGSASCPFCFFNVAINGLTKKGILAIDDYFWRRQELKEAGPTVA